MLLPVVVVPSLVETAETDRHGRLLLLHGRLLLLHGRLLLLLHHRHRQLPGKRRPDLHFHGFQRC
jgi:hypothetical protein